jgi:hypothetical protein
MTDKSIEHETNHEFSEFKSDLKSLAFDGLYLVATLLVLSGIELLLHVLTLPKGLAEKFGVLHENLALASYLVFGVRSLGRMVVNAWREILKMLRKK